MKLLLVARARLSSTNDDGRAPLQVVLGKKNENAVILLLKSMEESEIGTVRLIDWLKLGSRDKSWVQVSKRLQNPISLGVD
jgi:hypothetical protein